jgi:hypothetical protein
MGGLTCRNEEFRRHAADAGTSGAVRTAFNQDDGRARRLRRTIRWEPGTAGADYRYIDLSCFHDFL